MRTSKIHEHRQSKSVYLNEKVAALCSLAYHCICSNKRDAQPSFAFVRAFVRACQCAASAVAKLTRSAHPPVSRRTRALPPPRASHRPAHPQCIRALCVRESARHGVVYFTIGACTHTRACYLRGTHTLALALTLTHTQNSCQNNK